MNKEPWILKLMNIRREEAKPVFLLMCFSFFTGMTLTFYFTASNAIFLKHFQRSMIPISFMASGVLIYLAWWSFSRIDKKLSFSYQILIKFIFIFITVLAVSIGVWSFKGSSWLIFMMYTWVRIVVYILLVNFWGVAGKLFNIRQGKRIFGIIGIGEVVSVIIGYFSVPLILQFLTAPDLLFVASAALFICLMLVILILKVFREQLLASSAQKAVVKKTVTKEWNYLNLIRKPYFVFISLMALLPIFGYLFVDFLFLAQTKKEFPNNPEAFARFLGLFLGFVAVIELSLKFVSGRFLNKYGLKPSLISLPLILLVSIFMAAVFGTIYGTVGLFFTFIALARLFEKSVRGAVYEPAFQLLYQPVPTELRLTFQNQIEGIPKALGTLATGAVILLLSSFPSFSLVSFNWIFCIVLGGWIWAAFKMYEEYRNMLKTKLSELKTKSDHEKAKMTDIIGQIYLGAGAVKFENVFQILETAEPVLAEKAIETAFVAAPPVLQKKFLKTLVDREVTSALPFLKGKGTSSIPDPEIRKQIETTTEELTRAENDTFETLTEMARSHDPVNRLRAARMLGTSARFNAFKLLLNLIKDPDLKIRNAAIISAGKIRRIELWPAIIENLSVPECARAASIAIRSIGEPILSELDRHFNKMTSDHAVQLEIISIYESIPVQKTIKLLRRKMNHPDRDIRYGVLFSLSNLNYHAIPSEIQLIQECIEETVEYIAWILASLNDMAGVADCSDLQVSLLAELDEKKEQVFLLLSLIYDSKTISHIREHIESKDATAKVYALEISDMIISDEIKELFFPVFEDLSVHERLSRMQVRFPQETLSSSERLIDILNKGYAQSNRMTKVFAISLLGKMTDLPAGKAENILAANLVHPDPLLSEVSAWMLFNLNRNYYLDTMVRFEKKWESVIPELAEKIKRREKDNVLLLFEKVLFMKGHELFSALPDQAIIQFLMRHPGILQQKSTITGYDNKFQEICFTDHDGATWTIPTSSFDDFLKDAPEFTEKFFRYLNITIAN